MLVSALAACGPRVPVDESTDGAPTSAGDGGDPSTARAMDDGWPGTTTVPPSTTGATTAVSDEGAVDETAFDTADFINPQDVPGDCDTIAQNCPPGMKCMPYVKDGGASWNATRCVEIADDPVGPGERCTAEGDGLSGIDDCDGTSMCWNVGAQMPNEGVCVPFCTGSYDDPSCSDPCAQCTISGDGTLTLCLPGCDPLAPDCREGESCVAGYDERFICVPDASAPETEIGSPCEFINTCPPGAFCVGADALPNCEQSVGCCAAVCSVEAQDTCESVLPGTQCLPYFEENAGPPEGCVSGTVGVCVLP